MLGTPVSWVVLTTRATDQLRLTSFGCWDRQGVDVDSIEFTSSLLVARRVLKWEKESELPGLAVVNVDNSAKAGKEGLLTKELDGSQPVFYLTVSCITASALRWRQKGGKNCVDTVSVLEEREETTTRIIALRAGRESS